MRLSAHILHKVSRTHLYYAACIVVLIAAAALRFYNLSENSLWYDEAVAALNSRQTFWEVPLHTISANSSPLLISIYALGGAED